MSERTSVGTAAIFSREFWTFRTVNTVAGAVLSLAAALGSLFLGGYMRDQVAAAEQHIREVNEMIGRIDRANFEYKSLETSGTLVQMLSAGNCLPDNLKTIAIRFAFIQRQGAYRRLVALAYPGIDDYKAAIRPHEEAVAKAQAGDLAAANRVVEEETSAVNRTLDLQGRLIEERSNAMARRDEAAARQGFYATTGAILQQVGLLVVLFAGLVGQHRAGREPAPAGQAAAG